MRSDIGFPTMGGILDCAIQISLGAIVIASASAAVVMVYHVVRAAIRD